MAQIRFTSDGRTFAGRNDLTDHDHDQILLIFQAALESVPMGTDVLNIATMATVQVRDLARAQGWTDAAAERFACAAGLLYAEIITSANREEQINAGRR